jgi:NitT/TauT family transport system substrate-binding protein
MSKTSIQLEFFHPWPNHAGLFLAEDDGLFRDAGIDVELNGRDPLRGTPLDHLVRGEVDFCIDLTRELLRRREAGTPVCAIAAINHERLDAIITLREKGVQRPRDLEGRSVGLVSSVPLQTEMLSSVTADGGDASTVTTVFTGDRETNASDVQRGLFDAAFAYAPWEGVLHPELGDDVTVVSLVDFNTLSYQPYMLMASEDLVQRNPALVENVVQAARTGYARAIADPDKAAAVMKKVIPFFADRAIEASCRALAARYWANSGDWGTLDDDRLAGFARYLVAKDLLGDVEAATGAFATV